MISKKKKKKKRSSKCRNPKFKRFFRPKLGDLKKKRSSKCRNSKFKRFFRPKLGCLKLCNTHHSLRFGSPLKIFFRIQLPDKKCFLRFVSPEIRISRIRNSTLYNPSFDILYNPLQCYTVTVHLHIYQKTNADQKPWRKTNLCKSKIFFGSGTLSNNVAVQQSVDKILKIGVSKRPMAVGKKFLSNLFDNTILVQHQNFDSNLEQQPFCLVPI